MDELDLGSTIKGFFAGQRVFGRYQLRRLLGRGGMGVVWLAGDEELERDVALKFLPEVVAADPEAVRDLKRETRRSLQLTHPNIIRIYDFTQDARLAAISMEFVDGATLTARKLENPHSRFEPADLGGWVRQLLEALAYAHTRAEVVHRDLKPANLMIDARGELKVADFGIAASVSDSVSRVSAQAGSSGTPVYMSPQQMMGERPAVTDDIYAIGATLYDLLTGKPPFYSGNVAMQVQGKVPPTLAQRRSELGGGNSTVIPAEWEATVAACLAKDPADRPQSAREIGERLGLFGVGAVVPAAGAPAVLPTVEKPEQGIPSTPGRPDPGGRFKPVRALVVAALLSLLAAVGWYFGVARPARIRAEAEEVEASRQREEAARLERVRAEETATQRAREEQARLAAAEQARRNEAERVAAEQRRLAAEQAQAEELDRTRGLRMERILAEVDEFRRGEDLSPEHASRIGAMVQSAAAELDDARRARVEAEWLAASRAMTELRQRVETATAEARDAWRVLRRQTELATRGLTSGPSVAQAMATVQRSLRYTDAPTGRLFLLTRHGFYQAGVAGGAPGSALFAAFGGAGFRLSIDDGPAQEGAGMWDNLMPGAHRFRIEREGFEPVEREVDLAADEFTALVDAGAGIEWIPRVVAPSREEVSARFVDSLSGEEWAGKFGAVDSFGLTVVPPQQVKIVSYGMIRSLQAGFTATIVQVDPAARTLTARYDTTWKGMWDQGAELVLRLAGPTSLEYSTGINQRPRTFVATRSTPVQWADDNAPMAPGAASAGGAAIAGGAASAEEILGRFAGAEWKGKISIIDPIGIRIGPGPDVVLVLYPAIGSKSLPVPIMDVRVDVPRGALVGKMGKRMFGEWKEGATATLSLTPAGMLELTIEGRRKPLVLAR